MRKIVLISCASKKLPYKAKARNLYISPLFKKNLVYAQKLAPDAIFILSAKYGLVDLDQEIELYDLTLNNMTPAQIKIWANRVLTQLTEKTEVKQDHFIFLAGLKYRKHLFPRLSSFEIQMEGLPIGKQLQALTRKMQHEPDLRRTPSFI